MLIMQVKKTTTSESVWEAFKTIDLDCHLVVQAWHYNMPLFLILALTTSSQRNIIYVAQNKKELYHL